MNFEELKKLTNKILKNGIEIKDKEYLKEIYQYNDYNILFKKLNEILNKCKTPRLKLCYAFAYYIGFFNINSEQNINELPDIKKLESYKYLKGGLMLYFKDEIKIKYNYQKVSPYHDKYYFVANWYPLPFSIHYSLINLLNWIYIYDEEQFYKFIISEKHNQIFLSTLKGLIIRNFKINPNYLYQTYNDEIKLYGLFNYLMYPYTDYRENLNFTNEELSIWRFNIRLIQRINNQKLIEIIINYIKYKETKKIPLELLDIIKDNLEQFYTEYDKVEALNMNEIHQLYFIKDYSFLSRHRLFELILKKLKLKLSREYITINENDWKIFLQDLDNDELKKLLKLMEELKNNLKYTSELDKEIRFKKYLIDTQKYDKINELISLFSN